MATEFDSKKWGAILAIPFGAANATTGESNTDLTAAGGQTTVFIVPAGGSILGISASCPAITAGSVTLTPHKASTEYAHLGVPQPVLSSTNDTNGTYGTIRPGVLTFAAGDAIGISMTSTTTLNPTNTIDVEAVLFIQLNA